MTKFKRITTAALAAAMLLPMSSIGASAADADAESTIAESEVLYQQTFSYWDMTNWSETTAVPGMVLANADSDESCDGGSHYYTNIKQYEEEDGGKSALMFRNGNNVKNHSWDYKDRNGAFDVIPFNKVINSGKIYFSTDFYVPEFSWNSDENRYYNESDLTGTTDQNNAKKISGVAAFTLFNTSTVDYTDNTQTSFDNEYMDGSDYPNKVTYKATGEELDHFIAADSQGNHWLKEDTKISAHQSEMVVIGTEPAKFNIQSSQFRRVMNSAVQESIGNETTYNDGTNNQKNKWHKLEVTVDCDTTVRSTDGNWEGNPVKVYLDGELINGNASTAKLVSDNVSGYKGIGIYRRSWMRGGIRFDNMYVSHYNGSESGPTPIVNVSEDNKHISAALSEYVKDKPSIDGFVIKNASTGKIISGYTATERENEYVFDFDQPLADGKYKIYHKSAVGAITEKTNTDGATFFINNGGAPVFDKATVYDYKNLPEAISTDDVSSDGTRIMPVSARAKKIKVTFSADMSGKSVEDKIYLKDSNGTTIGAQYTTEGKDVYLALDEWLSPGEKYTLCVDKDGQVSQGGGDIVLDVKNENICVLFDEKFDAGRKRATMSGSVFKSNSGEQKNTMLLASYIKRTDDNGNEFLELLDAKWQKLDATGQGLFNGSIMMSVSDGADIVRGYIFNDETGRLMTDNYFEKIISE